MMQKKTSLSEDIGKRCDVCIGCGRCVEEKRGMHVLTGAFVEKAPVWNGQNSSLIVADIGTTTIAMQLYGKGGKVLDTFVKVNPQTVFGADVLSRIQAAENPTVAKQMQQQVQEVLQQGIRQFRELLNEGEALRMVIAANTTMVYLLKGWKTAELGRAPFGASHLEATEIEMDGVYGYLFPGVSAFVGGDIVAGILASGMQEQEELTLLIDLGTNGEIVLGNRDKILACSTAAGPAFEGGVNRGIWGADMVSLLAELRKRKLVDETGLLAEPYFEQGVHIGGVCITQESVRAIQLAKAAIAAGIEVLVQEYGATMERIERVILAGGFGYYLNPREAATIGLLPAKLAGKTVSGGNMALAGALRYGAEWLSHRADEAKLSYVKEKIEIVNLAEDMVFQEKFISYIDFPDW